MATRGMSIFRRLVDGSRRELTSVVPDFGVAGSRSAEAFHGDPLTQKISRDLDLADIRRCALLRWLGTVGSVLIMIGGWGAGAMPVVNNTLWRFPVANLMGRMLLTSTVMVFVGIGFLVLAWALMGYLALATPRRQGHGWADAPAMVRTFVAWVIPLAFTAPLFTQDIYSYIAQGAIASRGLNPYYGGPVDLLGVADPLARSVPLVWSHSPSPYGPVAIMGGHVISWLTNENVMAAVFLYRLVSIAGLGLCAWAVTKLAHRCGVEASAALWLGVVNPLSLLHLVGGIHNESMMLGLLMVGMEWCFRAFDRPVKNAALLSPITGRRALYFIGGVGAICCAIMVKVTSVVALGFVWVALVRYLRRKHAWLSATVIMASLLAFFVIGLSFVSGLGLHWLAVQGGAADIVSWMSITTLLGIFAAFVGNMLGLGDHTGATTAFVHGVGLIVAALWMVRMLLATYRGRLHPIGGYGVGMLVLVLLFPVVHPWYALWAIIPLAAWANQPLFRNTAVIYSIILSFFVLPRGLKLPAWSVAQTYIIAAASFVVLVGLGCLALKLMKIRPPGVSLEGINAGKILVEGEHSGRGSRLVTGDTDTNHPIIS
ncbi:polyprenol phosphomannose-dependent alpha 1,6 mannosyltransferase MptB [Corynebacterium kroppenstedtii]|uniref:polyprenol phosphomannose-dependent alpha 1,6 mannosyltransferase MptB n=1 Tax=Corynebacterium sp. PCR 32 TaxID=3351342 RepID=UPI00309779D4